MRINYVTSTHNALAYSSQEVKTEPPLVCTAVMLEQNYIFNLEYDTLKQVELKFRLSPAGLFILFLLYI
jgi:hypothetical protein